MCKCRSKPVVNNSKDLVLVRFTGDNQKYVGKFSSINYGRRKLNQQFKVQREDYEYDLNNLELVNNV